MNLWKTNGIVHWLVPFLVTFWFSTFATLYHATCCLVSHENTWGWMVYCYKGILDECMTSLSECMCRMWTSCMHTTVIRMLLNLKSQNIISHTCTTQELRSQGCSQNLCSPFLRAGRFLYLIIYIILQVATALLVAGSTLTFWIPPFVCTSSYSSVVQSVRLLV